VERFVIRNYGPSRNLPDGHGSYIFIEKDRIRGTSDPVLAKLFATYPQINVTDRGVTFTGPPAIQPPEGPPPPIEPDDIVKAVSYDALDKSELQVLAKARGIPTAHVSRLDLITALQTADREEKAAKIDTSINYEALSYKDLQEVAKERGIRSVGVSRAALIGSLKADDEVEPEPEETEDSTEIPEPEDNEDVDDE